MLNIQVLIRRLYTLNKFQYDFGSFDFPLIKGESSYVNVHLLVARLRIFTVFLPVRYTDLESECCSRSLFSVGLGGYEELKGVKRPWCGKDFDRNVLSKTQGFIRTFTGVFIKEEALSANVGRWWFWRLGALKKYKNGTYQFTKMRETSQGPRVSQPSTFMTVVPPTLRCHELGCRAETFVGVLPGFR